MRNLLKKLVVLLVVWPLVLPQVFAEQDDPAREQLRSTVVTQFGIVAPSQAVASRAGAAVLAKGGSEMAAMPAS